MLHPPALPVVLAALIAAAGPAAAAHADAPWTAPAAVPGATGSENPIVITAAGHGALLSASDAAAGATSLLTPVAPDGTLGAPRPVGRLDGARVGLALAKLATYGHDRLVAVGTAAQGGSVGSGAPVVVGFGSPQEGIGALRRLPVPKSEYSLPLALAADARGAVAVVVGASDGRRTVLLRRPGASSFRVAFAIPGRTRGRGAALAFGPRGDLLVAWGDPRAVYARQLGASGHAGPVHRLGAGFHATVQAAVDAAGRLSVAWEGQEVHEGYAATPAVIAFASAAPGRPFGPARVIETVRVTGIGRYVAAPGVRLVRGVGTSQLLTWTGHDGKHFVVRGREVRDGRLGSTQTVSEPGGDAVLGDAAVGVDGSELVLWRSGIAGHDPSGPGHPVVWASARPAGASAFGAPELVSPADQDVVEAPAVALDPISKRALSSLSYLTASPGVVAVASRAG